MENLRLYLDPKSPDRPVRLRLCGQLCDQDAIAFAKTLDRFVRAGTDDLTLDLHGVTQIDARGLETIKQATRRLQATGRQLRVEVDPAGPLADRLPVGDAARSAAA